MTWITVKISHLLLVLQGLHNYHSWHHLKKHFKQWLTKCFLLRTLLACKLKSLSYLPYCKCKCPFRILSFCSIWVKKLGDLENPWGNCAQKVSRDSRTILEEMFVFVCVFFLVCFFNETIWDIPLWKRIYIKCSNVIQKYDQYANSRWERLLGMLWEQMTHQC